jgi:hypothetical protein
MPPIGSDHAVVSKGRLPFSGGLVSTLQGARDQGIEPMSAAGRPPPIAGVGQATLGIGCWALLAWSCAVLLVAGCVTAPPEPAWRHTGDPIADGKAAIAQGPARDRVLWQYRTALEAMRRSQFGEAKALLDDALVTLNGIYGPDPEARRARGYFRREARKTFIGEPYERVMAYYYRGILYWIDGEPDNARACFRSAQFMDGDSENREYRSDYALLDYLEGFATAKLGGDGADALARARSVARLASPPEYAPKANLLCFIEFGRGPVKIATGEYGEQLRFSPGSASVDSVVIRGDHLNLEARAWDDLSFQATTRGGRVMDHVLGNKAVFKRTTDAVGNAAILGGAIMAAQQGQHSAVDEAGVGLLVAGLVSKIVSAATTPAADTRMWDNLPQYLSFARAEVPVGTHALTLEFQGRDGRPIAERTSTVTVRVEDGRDTVIFVSDNNP